MNESRPGEPVCSCHDVEALLTAYVDGEAPTGDGDKVRAHVEACGACRERLAGERLAREAIRARRAGLRPCASDALKARCAAHARAGRPPAPLTMPATPSRGSRASLVRRWAPLSLAASVLLAVAAVFGLGLNDKVQALAFQTTIDHVKCARFNAGSHATPADAARQWESRFGWSIAVPPSSNEARLELRGIRRCGVLDGRIAHLMYSWMGQPLSVYVLPKRTVADEPQIAERFGHNAVMWSRNDRTYIVVTAHRRDPALDQMVAYVKATAH